MMKKLILFTIVSFLAFTAFGQSEHEFKTIAKKNPGTAQPEFSYKTIERYDNLKTADTPKSFMISPLFEKPANQGDPVIKRVMRCKDSGNPIFIELRQSQLKSAPALNPQERFLRFFETTGDLTGIKNPAEGLLIREIYTDAIGITHIKARQLYHGVEIYGAEAILHLNNQKEIFTGRLSDVKPDIHVVPQIDSESAIDFAIDDLKALNRWKDLSEQQKEILNYDSPSSGLVIYTGDNEESALCYEIDLRANFLETWKYFIDAVNGQVISKYNNTKTDGPAVASAYDLHGVLRTIDT